VHLLVIMENNKIKNLCLNLNLIPKPTKGKRTSIKSLTFNCYIKVTNSCTISDISQILNICMHFILSFKCHVFNA
jgi:hypothetical protein